MFLVVGAGSEVEGLEFEAEVEAFGCCFEARDAVRHDFLADAIAGDDGDPEGFFGGGHFDSWEADVLQLRSQGMRGEIHKI